jgi:peptide/nickel transport system substrate-binding protein
MIGTGPFQLVSWENGKVMKLKKNPNYWRKDADGVQLPYLDELEYYPIDGNTNRYDALEGNTVQAAMFNNQVQVDALSTNDKYAMVNEAAGHREVAYGLTNVSKAPLDDIEVRKHVGMAIDRDRLNEINSEGAWDIANGPFDTDVMGYLEDPGMVKYDKAAATEFFKGKSIAFRLSFATDATTEQIANEVKRQLAEVGVEVTVDQKDQPTLIDQAIAGDFNVLLWRNHPGADPDTQYVWWHSGMPTNFGRINDPRVDKALDEGRVESDPAKRKAIYEDLNKALVEGAYNLWNWRTEWTTGHYATVHGLGDATLPDGSKTAGQWAGWHAMTEAWVEK